MLNKKNKVANKNLNILVILISGNQLNSPIWGRNFEIGLKKLSSKIFQETCKTEGSQKFRNQIKRKQIIQNTKQKWHSRQEALNDILTT